MRRFSGGVRAAAEASASAAAFVAGAGCVFNQAWSSADRLCMFTVARLPLARISCTRPSSTPTNSACSTLPAALVQRRISARHSVTMQRAVARPRLTEIHVMFQVNDRAALMARPTLASRQAGQSRNKSTLTSTYVRPWITHSGSHAQSETEQPLPASLQESARFRPLVRLTGRRRVHSPAQVPPACQKAGPAFTGETLTADPQAWQKKRPTHRVCRTQAPLTGTFFA